VRAQAVTHAHDRGCATAAVDASMTFEVVMDLHDEPDVEWFCRIVEDLKNLRDVRGAAGAAARLIGRVKS
jgi:hypothetical protein